MGHKVSITDPAPQGATVAFVRDDLLMHGRIWTVLFSVVILTTASASAAHVNSMQDAAYKVKKKHTAVKRHTAVKHKPTPKAPKHATPVPITPVPITPVPVTPVPVTPVPATPTPIVSTGSATIAGCPLFPADNPWRRNVSADPIAPQSGSWITNIGTSGHLHPDFGSDPSYGIPYVVVPASQTKVPITFTDYGDESDPGPYPVPLNAPKEAGGDAHVLVASGDCHLYELYGAQRTSDGWAAASGAVFDLQSNALRPDGWTSADAAGLPILPGLVRPDEIAAGHIDHALRFTVSRTQRGYIHPATHQAGSTTDSNVIPMGARLRLKASFDTSSYHGAALIILKTLKTYGMIVADNGSNWYISGATYTGWNDDDLNQLKNVAGGNFEVVSSGPVLH
jgi:hypothetical protein